MDVGEYLVREVKEDMQRKGGTRVWVRHNHPLSQIAMSMLRIERLVSASLLGGLSVEQIQLAVTRGVGTVHEGEGAQVSHEGSVLNHGNQAEFSNYLGEEVSNMIDHEFENKGTVNDNSDNGYGFLDVSVKELIIICYVVGVYLTCLSFIQEGGG